MQTQGPLLSATIPNPRNHENVNVVIIRSQKVVKAKEERATNNDHFIGVDLEVR